VVADLTLDKEMLQEVIRRKGRSMLRMRYDQATIRNPCECRNRLSISLASRMLIGVIFIRRDGARAWMAPTCPISPITIEDWDRAWTSDGRRTPLLFTCS
jgi:hypothetical protein